MDEQRKNKEEICYQILLNERGDSIHGQSSSYIPLRININIYVCPTNKVLIKESLKCDLQVGLLAY